MSDNGLLFIFLMLFAGFHLLPNPACAVDRFFVESPHQIRESSGIPAEKNRKKESREQCRVSIETVGNELAKDIKYIFTASLRIDRKSAIPIGIVAASLGGLMIADEDIQDYFQRRRTDSKNDVADVLETIGSAGTIFVANMGLIGTGIW
ncbi:hypothetical protein ACFLZG_01005, partial [Thermodesulfobacteriota bacterium]